MLTSDILTIPENHSIIIERCSQFIEESNGFPLFKNLACTHPPCARIKVRQKKHQDLMSPAFNEAFNDHTHNIRQRSIFALGESTFISDNNSYEPFYVFPIDGYKFIYSSKINDSSDDYLDVFESLVRQYGNHHANETLTEILTFSYTSNLLAEGILSGAEIILYNIPFYYAIKVSSVSSYATLF